MPNKLAKSKNSTKKAASESLSLQQKLGGAMSVGSQNVLSEPSFPAPFNISSGGSKPSSKHKRVKKVVADPNNPNKPKKKLSAYNLFVKAHMKDFKDMPAKQRMSAVAKLYKESKK